MAIEDELYRDVHVLEHPQYTVAYGAARFAEKEVSIAANGS